MPLGGRKSHRRHRHRGHKHRKRDRERDSGLDDGRESPFFGKNCLVFITFVTIIILYFFVQSKLTMYFIIIKLFKPF